MNTTLERLRVATVRRGMHAACLVDLQSIARYHTRLDPNRVPRLAVTEISFI
jgi:hypothetical protein